MTKTKRKVRTCRAEMYNPAGCVICTRETGHPMPHRSARLSWYNEDSGENLGRRYAEWTKRRGTDAQLVARKTQEKRPTV